MAQPNSNDLAVWSNLNAKWKADDTNDNIKTIYGYEKYTSPPPTAWIRAKIGKKYNAAKIDVRPFRGSNFDVRKGRRTSIATPHKT